MNLFAVPTFDQQLTLDGRSIAGDGSASLGQLRFYPGCLVLLAADQPTTEDPTTAADPTTGENNE